MYKASRLAVMPSKPKTLAHGATSLYTRRPVTSHMALLIQGY